MFNSSLAAPTTQLTSSVAQTTPVLTQIPVLDHTQATAPGDNSLRQSGSSSVFPRTSSMVSNSPSDSAVRKAERMAALAARKIKSHEKEKVLSSSTQIAEPIKPVMPESTSTACGIQTRMSNPTQAPSGEMPPGLTVSPSRRVFAPSHATSTSADPLNSAVGGARPKTILVNGSNQPRDSLYDHKKTNDASIAEDDRSKDDFTRGGGRCMGIRL